MKKTSLLTVLLLVACTIANAQGYTTLGVGTSSPKGTLHVHNSAYDPTGPDMPPLSPGDDGGDPRDDPFNPFHHSTSTIHLTNRLTDTALNRGFVIKSADQKLTMYQYEDDDMLLVNHDAELILSSSGKVGIGAVSSGYHVFNVNGASRFAGGLTVTGGMSIAGGININNTSINLTSSGKAYFADEVSIGSGFYCSAAGALKVKSLRVTLTDWSDYVFDPAYRLMPLDKVERYVHEKHHLPDIPSAAEVEEQGVDVGEMNRLLLQKVEELTLYVIDLQKQLDELKMNR